MKGASRTDTGILWIQPLLQEEDELLQYTVVKEEWENLLAAFAKESECSEKTMAKLKEFFFKGVWKTIKKIEAKNEDVEKTLKFWCGDKNFPGPSLVEAVLFNSLIELDTTLRYFLISYSLNTSRRSKTLNYNHLNVCLEYDHKTFQGNIELLEFICIKQSKNLIDKNLIAFAQNLHQGRYGNNGIVNWLSNSRN